LEIMIKIGEDIQLRALLKNTETARRIAEALPLQGKGSTWGQEIYFSTPVDAPLEEDAREVLEEGELGYWPDLQAFCIFYGPTPASQGQEIRAAGPVNVFGYVLDDLSPLEALKGPVSVVVEKREENT